MRLVRFWVNCLFIGLWPDPTEIEKNLSLFCFLRKKPIGHKSHFIVFCQNQVILNWLPVILWLICRTTRKCWWWSGDTIRKTNSSNSWWNIFQDLQWSNQFWQWCCSPRPGGRPMEILSSWRLWNLCWWVLWQFLTRSLARLLASQYKPTGSFIFQICSGTISALVDKELRWRNGEMQAVFCFISPLWLRSPTTQIFDKRILASFANSRWATELLDRLTEGVPWLLNITSNADPGKISTLIVLETKNSKHVVLRFPGCGWSDHMISGWRQVGWSDQTTGIFPPSARPASQPAWIIDKKDRIRDRQTGVVTALGKVDKDSWEVKTWNWRVCIGNT